MIHVTFMPLSCKGKRYEKHVTDNIIVNIHEIKEIQRFMQCSY